MTIIKIEEQEKEFNVYTSYKLKHTEKKNMFG